MDNGNNKKKDTKVFRVINKRLVIVLLLLVITVVSGTFAWYTYQSKKSALVLTIGDITDARVVLKPYQINETMVPVNTYENQVYTQVEVNTSSDIELSLYYKINELSTELVNNGLKYTIVQSTSANGTYSLVKTGDFKSYTDNKLDILTVELSSNTYYRIYVWLDSSVGTQSNLQNLSLDIELNGTLTSLVSYVEPADPVLDDGMIPVTIANDGTVTTIKDSDSGWYSYEDKEWANAVVVGNDYRSTYKGTTGVEVNEDHILGYYVWIPRFKYQVWTTTTSSEGNEQEILVIFEDADTSMSAGTSVGSYRTHPAFWWDDDSDGIVDSGETVAGIWVGKFETSANTDSTCYTSNSANNCLPANVSPRIVPNVKSLRYQTVSNQFATSQKFSASGNTYGLSSTSTNAHMMKNSEWGAVAYLSHSAYGINGEIYINNSSGYYTGRSGGNVGGSVNGLAIQFPDDQTATTQYNSYGYYTWTGQAISSTGTIGEITDSTLGTNASTTGNTTGVYDMSGGVWEYVMGNFGDTIKSSGFSTMPDSKYYDLYSSNQFTGTYSTNASLCTLATCGGAALDETYRWYSDYAYFVASDYPWFNRGGSFVDGANAGAFAFNSSYGSASDYRSWRSVLVVGFGA